MLKPSELEIKILSVLWEHGPLPVREVLTRMPDGKQRAYTSILSAMQVMEKKGLLGHRQQGTAHVFHPEVAREDVMRPIVSEMARNVFGGKPSAVLQCLFDADGVDSAELTEIRKLLREYSARAKREEK